MVFGSWPVFWFVKVQKGTFKYLDIKVCIDVLVYIEHMYTYVYIKSHVQLFTGTCVWFLCTLSWSRQSGSSDNWNQSNLPFAIIISFIQDVKNTKSLLLFLRVFFHVGKVWQEQNTAKGCGGWRGTGHNNKTVWSTNLSSLTYLICHDISIWESPE